MALPFILPPLQVQLDELGDLWGTAPFSWGGPLHNIDIVLTGADDPTIRFGEHEVPATSTGLESLASYLKIPAKFFNRLEADEQEFLLRSRRDNTEEANVSLDWSGDGVQSAYDADKVRLSPAQIARVAANVLPANALISEAHLDTDELRLDVVLPDNFAHGVGGDTQTGDITKGGLRFYHNRKRNLAPEVQPFLYRLVCTNGLEAVDTLAIVDARNKEAYEVEAQLESAATHALSTLNDTIAAFYDTRSQKIGHDRSGVLMRLARESGLPDRTQNALVDFLPSILESDEVTQFDLINAFTHFANGIEGHYPIRRKLQQAAGRLVDDHVSRCGQCSQIL